MKPVRFFALFILILCLKTIALAEEPQIIGRAAAVINVNSGKFVYLKNADQKMYPASTTKIMTTLIALEKGNLSDRVYIDKEACYVEGSAIWLNPGEQLSLEDLLYSIMLNSANDSAIAVAKYIGGDVATFVQEMNDKARELGAKNTHFVNPNGLPNDNHYTTARDLALIARAAMQNPKFREIAATKTKVINRDPKYLRFLQNHNKLLWRYEGANGIKTGYTVKARQCLVASAARDGEEFIAVVLGSEGRNVYDDATKLLDYAFNNFKTVKLVSKGQEFGKVEVAGGKEPVKLIAAEDLYDTVNRRQEPQFDYQKKIEKLQAPVKAGQRVGKIVVKENENVVGEVKLVAFNSVEPTLIYSSRKLIYPGVLFLAGLFLTFQFLKKYGRIKPKY
ncbi:D-alanyl-D-alanine carboxypeptidase family protein [Carboxydothermus ferrireducens]|uniref:serine-type D-Ala-D-Ala carboxypeptidase n=1 Tax=Carboxydothermus ferrireducens DSM 11255 TaxID=1119529 RepID=A0ABX2RCC6_9THEO|nr:D-alanyl-D-alanine carboxypeptidase family protein [Carboxydothermus ferrireducens]NYE58814.1 D-alanyl-D-alanine carboxypeptidase (penicillin-binding protein 5/6) [Carboxydothermus ferrireducens DSM 11255]